MRSQAPAPLVHVIADQRERDPARRWDRVRPLAEADEGVAADVVDPAGPLVAGEAQTEDALVEIGRAREVARVEEGNVLRDRIVGAGHPGRGLSHTSDGSTRSSNGTDQTVEGARAVG